MGFSIKILSFSYQELTWIGGFHLSVSLLPKVKHLRKSGRNPYLAVTISRDRRKNPIKTIAVYKSQNTFSLLQPKTPITAMRTQISSELYQIALKKVKELLPQVNELTPADDPKMVELCHFSDIVEEYETENHPVGSKTVNDNGLSGNPFEKYSRFAGAWKDSVEYASEYHEREFAPTFSADKLFFTADTHFGHANIIKYCHRPFASVAEMDEVLVRNWNEVVPPDATIFHLGDFALDSKKRWRELFGQLNGKKKYLILGNHDRRRILDGYDPGFTEIFDRTCINVDGQLVILNHTPLEKVDSEFWNFESEAWQFYGHVHSGPLNTDNKAAPLIKSLLPTQYDVGVDNNGFKPVSFEQIRQTIMDKTENRSTKGFLQTTGYLNESHREYCEKATSSVAEMMKHPSSLEEAREQTRRSLQSKT